MKLTYAKVSRRKKGAQPRKQPWRDYKANQREEWKAWHTIQVGWGPGWSFHNLCRYCQSTVLLLGTVYLLGQVSGKHHHTLELTTSEVRPQIKKNIISLTKWHQNEKILRKQASNEKVSESKFSKAKTASQAKGFKKNILTLLLLMSVLLRYFLFWCCLVRGLMSFCLWFDVSGHLF